MDDGLEDYRSAAEQARRGLRDPRRLTAAYAVSLAGIAAFIAVLLMPRTAP
ncbi:hypothetical protein [Kitasatospora sp. NPDC092286]|uniref:hypothetical protein n=1 Tax=Kitasatospora sp. NPDC092286 TaxID=3364087 RepID=UPI0037FF16DE